jgi:glycosyltransferase involved in cell wall biosynthesis
MVFRLIGASGDICYRPPGRGRKQGMFVVQVAVVQGRGGIATAVAHYERMCRAVGIGSTAVFRGPSAAALRSEGFDVIDAPRLLTSPLGVLPGVLANLRGAITARAGTRPILVIVHSDLALNPLRALLPGAVFVTPCHSDKLKRKHRADLVVTLNAAQHELAMGRLGARPRIALLGNPYVAASPPGPKAAGAPRVNFVARFIETKGPMTLMRAAPLVRAEPAPEFRFVGAGPLDAELRAAAAHSGARVTFAGWLSAPFDTFHAGDVLVLPSAWEGLPYLLQEALDNGVPVIASDNPGNRAALGGGAFGALFPLGDAAALARAIEAVLGDLDAAKRRAENGRAALHERYGADPFWRALMAEVTHLERLKHA